MIIPFSNCLSLSLSLSPDSLKTDDATGDENEGGSVGRNWILGRLLSAAAAIVLSASGCSGLIPSGGSRFVRD